MVCEEDAALLDWQQRCRGCQHTHSKFIDTYMHIYVFIYICVCVYIYIYIYIYIYTYTRTTGASYLANTRAFGAKRRTSLIHICTHVHTHTHTHTTGASYLANTRAFGAKRRTSTLVKILKTAEHQRTHEKKGLVAVNDDAPGMYVCVCVCVCVCMHEKKGFVAVNDDAGMYVCMYCVVYVYMYCVVCVYVHHQHTYIHTYIHTVHVDEEEQTGPQAGVQWTPDGFVLVRSADVDAANAAAEKAPTQVCMCVCHV
jgi:hypothetical protein